MLSVSAKNTCAWIDCCTMLIRVESDVYRRSVSRNISAFFVLLSIIINVPFIVAAYNIPQEAEEVQGYFDFFLGDFWASKLTFPKNYKKS